jgi:hypothetical protein
MALKDLEDKKTDRLRGGKNISRVRRDILWAYNHMNKPDAKPPSEGAKMWAELARQTLAVSSPASPGSKSRARSQ